MKNFSILALLQISLALFAVSGCSTKIPVEEVAKDAETTERKSKEIDIQAFIVTKGGENIKLGLVTVEAIPRQEVEGAIEVAIQEREKKIAELESKVEALAEPIADSEAKLNEIKSRLEAAREQLKQAEQNYEDTGEFVDALDSLGEVSEEKRDAFYSMTNQIEKLFDSDFSEKGLDYKIQTWRNDNFKANTQLARIAQSHSVNAKSIKTAKEQIDKLEVEYSSSKHHDELTSLNRKGIKYRTEIGKLASLYYIYGSLPTATVSSKTDADGKCRLSLPSSEEWILAAEAKRSAAGTEEKYFWIVEAPNGEQSPTSFYLSNDNLLNSNNPLGL